MSISDLYAQRVWSQQSINTPTTSLSSLFPPSPPLPAVSHTLTYILQHNTHTHTSESCLKPSKSQRRENEQMSHRRYGPSIVLIKMKTKEETQKPGGLREKSSWQATPWPSQSSGLHWEMLPKRSGRGVKSSCTLRVRGPNRNEIR